ncbi:MAG: hypothetical protein FJY85_11675, partial [Deltaproteobacteria bacterium]|nr:hypothetical protein [Deltaproteobacteria bacterium]
MEIRSGDELASFLRKALDIEASFESISQWEDYINLKKDEFRDVVFELISESEKHKSIVESLISKTKKGSRSETAPLQPHVFNFKNKTEFEIMMDLSRYEKLAYDIYLNIREALKASDMSKLVEEGDAPLFFSTLDRLIMEEADHVARIASY